MMRRIAAHSNSFGPPEMRAAPLVWRFVIVIAALACATASSVRAEEPYLEFIRGLREHQHYDFVLSYLDELEASTDLPPEIREVLQYERGMTLLAQSKKFSDLDVQRDHLNQAAAALEQFVATHANHPLAGQANTDRATILLEQARVELWKSEEPSNEPNKEAFRQRARDLIGQARGVFQAAFDQHSAAFAEFDIFIAEEEAELRAQRDLVESRVLHAELSLAQCTYWLAHTYDKGSQEFRDTLTLASVEFEAIHTAHRQQIVGLLARLWQGKCFEEQDEIGAAMGIYDQFIDNPGTDPAMLQMLATAVHFKMICLNHESRQDYQAAEVLASAWFQNENFRLLRRTESGVGITYQRARALEGYAKTLPEGNHLRTDALNQALGLARSINNVQGQYKVATSRLIQEILLALNRDPNDPQDFESAFGLGTQVMEDVQSYVTRMQETQASGDLSQMPEIMEGLRASAMEMTRLFDLAIQLSRPNTDQRQLQLAHMRLAYGYLTQQKYYEAAAIAEWLMDKRAEDFPELAVECGFIGVMAYDNAYTQAPVDNRTFEGAKLVAMATMLEERFPESPRANDARITIAKVYFNQGDHILAAEWFNKVPASADNYGEAQLQAGQSFWRAFNDALALDEAERPAGYESWVDHAAAHLSAGITARQALLVPEVPTPDDLSRGKLSLAALRVMQGAYSTQGDVIGAIELLSQDPHSVVSAIRVEPGQERPQDQSIRSTQLASYTLQQLLRAQIGAASQAEGDARQQFLEDSANTRMLLEELATEGGDEGALTQIYIDFGTELKKELDRIRESGDTARLQTVRESFVSFLGDVARRQEGQTLSSMVWIAETFAALGESAAEEGAPEAQSYFQQSANKFKEMLVRAGNEPGFVTDEQVVLIELSLARTHRRAGSFAEAETALNEVLSEHADMVDVQEEAAMLYEAWAMSDGDAAKFKLAINGRQDAPPMIWGWGKVARMLQGATQQPNPPADATRSFLNARVHEVDCLLAYSATGDTEDHKLALSIAKFNLESLVLTTNAEVLAPSMEDFDRQYGEVLTALGEPVISLSEVQGATAPETGEVEDAEVDVLTSESDGEAEDQEEEGGAGWGMIIALLLVGGGSFAGLVYLSINQNRKKRKEQAERRANRKQIPTGRAGIR